MSDSHEKVATRFVAVLGAGGTMGQGMARNAAAAAHPEDDLAILFRGTAGG